MKQHLDTLLTEGVNLAISFLDKNGEFFPFAIVLTNHGEIRHVQAGMNEEQPTSDDVISFLQNGLRESINEGGYCSIAIVSDVKLRDRDTGDENDAIRVDIEDQASSPITCYVPYLFSEGILETKDVISVAGKSFVFRI